MRPAFTKTEWLSDAELGRAALVLGSHRGALIRSLRRSGFGVLVARVCAPALPRWIEFVSCPVRALCRARGWVLGVMLLCGVQSQEAIEAVG